MGTVDGTIAVGDLAIFVSSITQLIALTLVYAHGVIIQYEIAKTRREMLEVANHINILGGCWYQFLQYNP